MALAMQADLSRVFTFMMSRESSQRTFPEIDIADPWHVVSHHGDQPEKVARNAKINALCLRMFAKFLDRLQSTEDGDGSLLDHSLLFYGSGMANSNVHATDPLPLDRGGRRRRLRAIVISRCGSRPRSATCGCRWRSSSARRPTGSAKGPAGLSSFERYE